MPKIKINIVNGKPVVPGVALSDGKALVPDWSAVDERYHDRHQDSHEYRVRMENGMNVTHADVDDLGPYRALLDRSAIVTVSGRPRATAENPD